MKKLIISFIVFFLSFNVYASTITKEATFVRCVDGDTALFNVEDEEVKYRFLAIDTPETVHPTKEKEEKGEDASTYTCNKLTNAKQIIIEMEESNKSDKYGRSLGWIWVDGSLLQQELIENGLAEVAYIYGKYRYTESLCLIQKSAKENKIGIWEKREEGYCSQIDTTNTENNINFENIKEKSPEDEIIDKIEKTEKKVSDFVEENEEKIESIYIYIFIGIAFIVMIYKQIKR